MDPDHRLRYTGADPFDRARFPGGDDATHLALGLGFAFRKLKIDIAGDFSDNVDTGAISFIYTF